MILSAAFGQPKFFIKIEDYSCNLFEIVVYLIGHPILRTSVVQNWVLTCFYFKIFDK